MKAILTLNDYEGYGIGAKARNMFILKKNGFNVPNLFVISALYLDEYLRERRVKITAILNNTDPTDYVSMSNACDQVKRIIYSLNTDSVFKEQVRGAVRKNIPNAKFIAIHSSTENYDTEGGILTRRLGNFLNVPVTDIVKYVIKAFASIFQPEILEYYHKKELPLAKLRMHVLVQEYNEAKVVGTMFTSNPAGLLNEAVIKMGSNETKDGKIQTSTTYYYNYTDKKHYYESIKDSVKISDAALKDLIETVEKIKELKDFNTPPVTNTAATKRLHVAPTPNYNNYRVGFSIINDKTVILEFEDVLNFKVNNVIKLDSRPLGKDMRGVNLPLTESFTIRAYANAFYGLAATCIGNVNLIEPFANEINNIVSAANGRVYYNLTNMNVLLGLLPIRSSLAPLKKAMRIEDEEKVNIFENMGFFSWLKFAVKFLRMFNKADKTEEKFIETTLGNFALLEQFNYNEMRSEDLIELLEEAMHTFSTEWSNVLLSELSLHICLDKLKSKLRTVGVKDPESYIKPLLFNNETELHKKALGKLCVRIINFGERTTFSRFKTDAEFNDFLEKEREKTGTGATFGEEIATFIHDHGKFIEGMYRLEDKNYAEHPMLLVNQINEILSDSEKLKEYMEVKVKKKPEFVMPPVGNGKKRIIKHYVKRIQANINNVERITDLKMQAYLEARNIFRLLGKLLTQARIITDESDIFYMQVGEVFDVVKNWSSLGEFSVTIQKLIVKRREEYKTFFDLPDNTQLVFADKIFNKQVFNAKYEGDDNENEYGLLGEYGVYAGDELETELDEELEENSKKISEQSVAEMQAKAIATMLGAEVKSEEEKEVTEEKVQKKGKEEETVTEPVQENTPQATPSETSKPQATPPETPKPKAPSSVNSYNPTPEEEARLHFERAQQDFAKKKNKPQEKIQKTNLTADQLRDRF
ncbi:MAG: PEP/pyruvate-binding domain-containing protein [Oscillospiraceae bacterium]|jgi:pyruvate,water dikinase|nr:PEP/pyruvate-binding domain-containing protein [Oscillospiraceae bacterium]